MTNGFISQSKKNLKQSLSPPISSRPLSFGFLQQMGVLGFRSLSQCLAVLQGVQGSGASQCKKQNFLKVTGLIFTTHISTH